MSALLFQSSLAGLFTLIPVLASILLVYSAMVVLGINLGIGTSMFASVAIGLGVDFSIHTLDRLRTLHRHLSGDIDSALEMFYPTTGRAFLLNFLAISCSLPTSDPSDDLLFVALLALYFVSLLILC